jgi:hypothetical protein
MAVEPARPNLVLAYKTRGAISVPPVDLLGNCVRPAQRPMVRVSHLVVRGHGTILTSRWSLATTRPFFTMYTSM